MDWTGLSNRSGKHGSYLASKVLVSFRSLAIYLGAAVPNGLRQLAHFVLRRGGFMPRAATYCTLHFTKFIHAVVHRRRSFSFC